MKIGPILKTVRIARNLKPEQLAFDLDVAASTLYRIESGQRTPSLELLEKIAEHLNLPISEIFRAVEGHPLMLDNQNGQVAIALDYTAETIQLVTEVQGFSARNMRLLIEFARLINKELGK